MSYIISVKYFVWNEEKNETLKKERDISFENALVAIAEGKILDVLKHPNQEKYPNQKIFILNINEYAYLIPFVEDDKKVFLKTIIPSRKATKKYLIERSKK